MNPTDIVVCYVEGKKYPRATCHVHHKDPRHAGGTDAPDNLIWLCANDHQLVHRAAQLIKANKKGLALDLADASYSSPGQRQRFLEIVNAEVAASVSAKEAGTGSKEIVVEVPIPRVEYMKLKLLISEYQSSKVSISDYVARLVLAHLRKKVG